MLELRFRLSSPTSQASSADLSGANEGVLRYDVLLGDITLRAEGCDLSTNWGWIPLIDFAACLLQAKTELSRNESTKSLIDFTESNSRIGFQRFGSIVRIWASYRSCQADVPMQEFMTATDSFFQELQEFVRNTYPALLQNVEFHRILPLFRKPHKI